MPITKYTHDEPEYNGRPVFIIRSPEGLTRTIHGVTFNQGMAKITDPVRAQLFDEQFPKTYKVTEDEKVVVDSQGYQITLPTGYKPWKNAIHPDADDYVDDEDMGDADAILVQDGPWE